MREQSFFSLTSEQSTMEWEHPSSPSIVLGSVFWIHRKYRRWTSWNMGVQLTPSSDPHWKACHRPSRECPSLLSGGVILLHDKAWLHSTAKFWIRNAGPYSSDLTPIAFIYFPPWMNTCHNIVSPLLKTSSMLISHTVLSILDGRTYHALCQVPQDGWTYRALCQVPQPWSGLC